MHKEHADSIWFVFLYRKKLLFLFNELVNLNHINDLHFFFLNKTETVNVYLSVNRIFNKTVILDIRESRSSHAGLKYYSTWHLGPNTFAIDPFIAKKPIPAMQSLLLFVLSNCQFSYKMHSSNGVDKILHYQQSLELPLQHFYHSVIMFHKIS